MKHLFLRVVVAVVLMASTAFSAGSRKRTRDETPAPSALVQAAAQECPICLDVLPAQTVVLHCNATPHEFCHSCIKKAVKAASNEDIEPFCAVCRTIIPLVAIKKIADKEQFFTQGL